MKDLKRLIVKCCPLPFVLLFFLFLISIHFSYASKERGFLQRGSSPKGSLLKAGKEKYVLMAVLHP